MAETDDSLWSVPPLIQVPNVKVMAISQYTQFLRCHSVLSLSVLTFLPTSRHSNITGEPVSIMPSTISFRRFNSILRVSWRNFHMWQYLLLRMALQEGPQQAADVVRYQQFPFLNQLDANAAITVVAFCDAAIHFAQTNVEVHKATRIITDCISPAAHLGIDIFCRGRSISAICAYPASMSFDFDGEHPDRWKTAQDFEIKFLQDLRSAVSVDSCEAALKAAGSRRSVALLRVESTLPHRGMLMCASTPRRHTVEVCASQGPQQAGHLLDDAPKGRQT